MKYQKFLLIIGIMLFILFLIGCNSETTPSSDTPAVSPEQEQPAEKLTPVPPTDTPVATPAPASPTNTPAPSCDLECTGSQGPSLEIKITCESGKYGLTKSLEEWDDDKEQYVTKITSESDEISEAVTIWKEWDDDKELYVTRFESMRIYKNSGNEYEIVATAYRAENAQGDLETKYYAEITGGVFGETPKICENE